jgi:hypothetical protein
MKEETIMVGKKIFSGLILLTIIVFLTAPTYAGDPARIGQAAGVQVQVPVSARDMAMGGANIALTSGLNALYWNPAGLPRMQNAGAGQFSRMTIFNDIGVSYLAVAFQSEDLGAIGLSIKSFDFGDIPFTTNEDMDAISGRTFSPTFVTIGLTYAKNLTEAVNVGVTAKVINETAPRVSGTAFAFDIGLQYDRLGGIDGVSFGVVIKNIGTNMQYTGSGLGSTYITGLTRDDVLKRESASNQLPASIELGAAYKAFVMEDQNLTVSGVFQSNNFENDVIRGGLEYAYQDMIFARVGYNFVENLEAEDQLYDFTLGAGIHYAVGEVDLTLDYAFRNSEYFDANNMFTLTIGF